MKILRKFFSSFFQQSGRKTSRNFQVVLKPRCGRALISCLWRGRWNHLQWEKICQCTPTIKFTLLKLSALTIELALRWCSRRRFGIHLNRIFSFLLNRFRYLIFSYFSHNSLTTFESSRLNCCRLWVCFSSICPYRFSSIWLKGWGNGQAITTDKACQ